MQKKDSDGLHPIQYASRSLSKEEMRYIKFEQEEVMVIFCLKRFCHYLLSEPFVIFSDTKHFRQRLGRQTCMVGWLDG